MNLSLLTGREAVQAVESPAFRTDWLALYERCPWATACQHPDFVLPWYMLYDGAFLPMIVLARSATGELLGLLTLAMPHAGGAITGAGGCQAEYQCWLSEAGDGDAFIRSAMASLHADFAGVDICLRYLPAGVPLGWTVESGHGVRHSVLRPHRRPLMHIDASTMTRQRNKKNHRQNYNRLSRIGQVAFEQVRCETRFARVFDDICMQYDFRQAALHCQTPFLSDPAKKRFFLELHRRGLLHTTILTVGGALAASHLGLLSSGRALHLGVNTHAPGFAAHSPGNLLLAMLGEHLVQDGLPLFDLTPGGDGYKEHFATGHDLVFELAVYGNARKRLASEARTRAAGWAKAGLRAAGYRSADLLAAVNVLRGGVRGMRGAAWPQGRHRPGGTGELRCRIDAGIRQPRDITVAKNRLADLLLCDDGAAPLGYWGFLRHAMQCMERAHDFHTVVLDDKLVLGCSLAALPNGDTLLSDLYVRRGAAGGGSLRSFLEQLLYDLQRQGSKGFLYCACDLDPDLQQAFVDSGFTDASQQATGLSNLFQTPQLSEPGP